MHIELADDRMFAKKIYKIFKALTYLERNKYLKPLLSIQLSELS